MVILHVMGKVQHTLANQCLVMFEVLGNSKSGSNGHVPGSNARPWRGQYIIVVNATIDMPILCPCPGSVGVTYWHGMVIGQVWYNTLEMQPRNFAQKMAKMPMSFNATNGQLYCTKFDKYHFNKRFNFLPFYLFFRHRHVPPNIFWFCQVV